MTSILQNITLNVKLFQNPLKTLVPIIQLFKTKNLEQTVFKP